MNISLVWPEKYKYTKEKTFSIPKQIISDLELDRIFSHFAFSRREYLALSFIFENISFDPEVIEYRLDVFEDLLNNPVLSEGFREVMLDIENLDVKRNLSRENDNIVYKVVARLAELESYIHCMDKLDSAFKKTENELKSTAFIKIRDLVQEAVADSIFPVLKGTLPDLHDRFRGIHSISIGINLDKNMMPFEATLLSVSKEDYTGKKNGVLRNLLKNKIDPMEGISRLHYVPRKVVPAINGSRELDPRVHDHAVEPMLVPLFRDVADIMKKTMAPIANALKRFSSVRASYLTDIHNGLVFYLHAVEMIKKLKSVRLSTFLPIFR